jgi:hypothetical protein
MEKTAMDRVTFWKTFNLCKEVSVAGNFIYNGIKTFDDIESFCFEDEIFEFLYNISVGIERLAKIVLVLREDITDDTVEDFEKTLITHNHLDLIKRIVGKAEVFDSVHYDLLHILTNFYKTYRYDRFSLRDFRNGDKEKQAITAYIEKYLRIEIENELLLATPNDHRIKKFVGRSIGKIVSYLYDQIVESAREKGVFTYEVRAYSKAYKIFLKKEFDFYHEDVLWKEVLVFCLNNCSDKYLELYKSLPPLDFDESIPCLVKTFKNDTSRQRHTDMLDTLYEDLHDKTERLAFLDIVGDDIMLSEEDMLVDEEISEQGGGEERR